MVSPGSDALVKQIRRANELLTQGMYVHISSPYMAQSLHPKLFLSQ